MSNSGQDQLGTDASVSTFTSALWFNAALSAGFFCAFNVLRTHKPKVYAPRTFAVEEGKRPQRLRDGYVLWMYDILRIPDEELIRSMGLDRFMVLKFLRMGAVVFTLSTVIIIPILIPINVVGQLQSPGLNLLTMGNVADSARTWAHLVLSVLLTVGVIYYIFRETRKFIALRRKYLLSPDFVNSIVARTLFVGSIPPKVNTVEHLSSIFNKFPGGVRRIWINRDLGSLPDDVNKRSEHVGNLEVAVTKAILSAYKDKHPRNQSTEEQEGYLIPEKLRPVHRVSPLPISIPCVGRKVDSINYYNDEIHQLNKTIHDEQLSSDNFPVVNSAFIEFNSQLAAHMASQTVLHHKELMMQPRIAQVAPTDVIWDNMNIKSFERLIRRGLSITITTAIIIFWAIPVALVQAVANLDTLSKTFPFLAAVQNLGPTVVGIIQGIIPAVALAILIALVPIIFTFLSKHEGIPQKSFVELSVLHKYFFFQYVDVVIVSTIAGGIFNILSVIQDPMSVVSVLAQNLPRASTFFITYVMLQATNGSAQTLLQLVPFILSFVMPFFSTSPRQIYTRKMTLQNINLGTLIPLQTVVFVLGLEYSTIAPLILPFVALYFIIQYFVYLYQFLYVYELEYETYGRAFPRAIRHIYIGMFTWHLTMIGLFGVRGKGGVGQLVIMVVTLVVSIFSLMLYDKSFKPAFKFLPVDIAVADIASGSMSPPINLAAEGKWSKDSKTQVSEEEPAPMNNQSASPPAQSSGANNADAASVCVNPYRMHSELRQRLNNVNANDGEITKIAKELYDTETYMHPAMSAEAPTVWLPQDELGISAKEIEDLRSLDIRATSESASVVRVGKKGKGKVKIDTEKLIVERHGIPGQLPAPGDVSHVDDYVRNVVANTNFIDAMGLTYGS